jgi:uncharacterized damage-inducible protein DinB
MINEVYGWVKETRRGMLAYCASIPGEVLSEKRPDFGHGSLLYTLLHIADCYRFWIAQTAFGREPQPLRRIDHPDVDSIARAFSNVVNPLVDEFIALHGGALGSRLSLNVKWQPEPLVVTPLWLLTHMITHEFHHKGQVVALGRILGYPPPETDLAGPGVGA